MITGANTNIRHRNVVFHVQTEDSGRANPHIISHLYHHGTILASEKTEYADQIDVEDLETVVRGMIESQHKEMLRRLKRGEFDATIDERLGMATGVSDTPVPVPAPAEDVDPVTGGVFDANTPVPELDDGLTPPPANAAEAAAAEAERTFGEGIVSQKPLDEVILDYLSDKARGRVDRPSPKQRSGA